MTSYKHVASSRASLASYAVQTDSKESGIFCDRNYQNQALKNELLLQHYVGILPTAYLHDGAVFYL